MRAGNFCCACQRVPGEIDPAFGLVVELLKRLGKNRIDGDAFARHDDADNALARNRSGFARNLEAPCCRQAAHRN